MPVASSCPGDWPDDPGRQVLRPARPPVPPALHPVQRHRRPAGPRPAQPGHRRVPASGGKARSHRLTRHPVAGGPVPGHRLHRDHLPLGYRVPVPDARRCSSRPTAPGGRIGPPCVRCHRVRRPGHDRDRGLLPRHRLRLAAGTPGTLRTTRNSPATGSSPCRATCSAKAAPWRSRPGPPSSPQGPGQFGQERGVVEAGSPCGGRAACHSCCHPSGNTDVTPAAGPWPPAR